MSAWRKSPTNGEQVRVDGLVRARVYPHWIRRDGRHERVWKWDVCVEGEVIAFGRCETEGAAKQRANAKLEVL